MFQLIERSAAYPAPWIAFALAGSIRNVFGSEKELGKLADKLGLTRLDLEAIWNGCAGQSPYEELKPVKKFRNRPYGVKQIWKVIQRLAPKKPSRGKRIAVPALGQPETTGNRAAAATKSAYVVHLMKQENGASGKELMDQTGWKPHTVRGFISTLQSKHGLKINSAREEGRGMVYRISA